MITVVLTMDETGANLNVSSAAQPGVVFGIVVAAYHLMLSEKIQHDLKAAQSRPTLADALTMQKAIESAKRIVS